MQSDHRTKLCIVFGIDIDDVRIRFLGIMALHRFAVFVGSSEHDHIHIEDIVHVMVGVDEVAVDVKQPREIAFFRRGKLLQPAVSLIVGPVRLGVISADHVFRKILQLQRFSVDAPPVGYC